MLYRRGSGNACRAFSISFGWFDSITLHQFLLPFGIPAVPPALNRKNSVRLRKGQQAVNNNGSIGTLASPAVLKTVMCLIKAIAGSTPAATASLVMEH